MKPIKHFFSKLFKMVTPEPKFYIRANNINPVWGDKMWYYRIEYSYLSRGIFWEPVLTLGHLTSNERFVNKAELSKAVYTDESQTDFIFDYIKSYEDLVKWHAYENKLLDKLLKGESIYDGGTLCLSKELNEKYYPVVEKPFTPFVRASEADFFDNVFCKPSN